MGTIQGNSKSSIYKTVSSHPHRPPQHTGTQSNSKQILDTISLLTNIEAPYIARRPTIPITIVGGNNNSNQSNHFPNVNPQLKENVVAGENPSLTANEETDCSIEQPLAILPSTNFLQVDDTQTKDLSGGLLLLPNEKAIATLFNLQPWQPSVELPASRSSNVLEVDCGMSEMMNIRDICCLPPSTTFVSHSATPQERITVKELCALVSHTSEINQQILNIFMTILNHQLGISFLDSSFFTLLKEGGWNRVKHWLRSSDQENQTHKPSLLNSAIIFPCHIHGCHWVAVT
jgi:hypothetical protein